MNVYNNAYELIGKTPLLNLKHIQERFALKGNILAKLEYFNPAGSAKDRIAYEMITQAEQNGQLKKGSVIIEPTSGNTGIGLCSVAAAKGYKTIIIMPSTMSEERRKIMKAYGAEIVLSDGSLGMNGAIAKANEIFENTPNAFIAGQFINPANPAAHYKTTAPEIYNDTDGKIDAFVCGVGTGGTLSGVGKFLKEKNKNIKIIAIEPFSSAVLEGKPSGKHKIQGIGAGFIPKTLNTELIDEIIPITDDEAYEYTRLIAKTEGVLVGISSGAALAAACKIALRDEFKNKNIVVFFPDGGDRYLSTDLF